MNSCPICGFKKLRKNTENRVIGDRLLGHMTIKEFIYKCFRCKQDIYGLENDDIYTKAEQILFRKAVPRMLAIIKKRGMNMAEFERQYGLPQRTTSRWKMGELSTAAVVLIKLTLLDPTLPMKYAESLNKAKC